MGKPASMSRRLAKLPRATLLAGVLALVGIALEQPVGAFTYVMDANGTFWGIQDAAPPRVDTGSIRATQTGPGDDPPLSTTINGFGGIRVWVDATPAPRLNGELLRGFGLQFDGVNRFETTQSLDFGGVIVSRSVYINTGANYGRWLDTFTNSTKDPITIKVAFGGQSGIRDPLGPTPNQASAIVNTSSGDAVVTAADSWVEVATPLAGGTLVGGPQVTVLGTPSPFPGSMTFAGNWLYDPFNDPLVYGGHEGNFQAYVTELTLQPKESQSLLHFVVLGPQVNDGTSAAERLEVEATATNLATAPDLDGLSSDEICSIHNFSDAALTAAGFDYADECLHPGKGKKGGTKKLTKVKQPKVPKAPKALTGADYDVVGKTIAELRADMEAGITTSEEITRAYLDRIAVYDRGQLGFNAYEYVAQDAIQQARAADQARAAGNTSPLLGIPIAIKNNYDTFDMPTTNGSITFEGFLPADDAFQVARLREAGAVIIGKAALEEYASFGHYSNDPWGQVWGAFGSRSPLASSGGSAVAVATSLAAAAMGSQTGDSLYAPASAASLVTLRGTDGLESGTGIMPLTWMVDFGGAMTRSVSDLADMLNAVVAPDPADPMTLLQQNIPDDWRDVLDPNALQGKTIGYVPAAWIDPFGTTDTTDSSLAAAIEYLEAAGATVIEIDDQPAALLARPSLPAGIDIRSEGWKQYIATHPELHEQGFQIFSEVEVNCSQKKVPYVREDPATCGVPPVPPLTADEIQAARDHRVTNQEMAADWLDAEGVDAVVYPGLLSDISLNDGGGRGPSFGRRDTPSARLAIPTVVIPAGVNSQGEPINIQLLGRAWSDAMLVGFAYAFEQAAEADGSGHVEPDTAPPLEFKKNTKHTIPPPPCLDPTGPACDAQKGKGKGKGKNN